MRTPIYTAEKVLKDLGDKMMNVKTKVNEGVQQVRDVIESEDVDAIKSN